MSLCLFILQENFPYCVQVHVFKYVDEETAPAPKPLLQEEGVYFIFLPATKELGNNSMKSGNYINLQFILPNVGFSFNVKSPFIC